jgi:hypothetical protein
MTDRFDLEQNIMQCWNVTDDVQLMLDSWDSLSEDAKQNYLIGLKQMYQLKFERLWGTFEKCVSTRKI